MDPLWPAALPVGATVGVVAPASPPVPERLDRGLAALAALGYRTVELPHVRQRHHYLAGHDEQRLADLHQAFTDPAIDAVWCARGGYGTMRLLRAIDWDLLAAHPKPFIGYSDITALQQAMAARLRWVTFSGPMVASGHGYGREAGIAADTDRDLWRWLRPCGPRQALLNPGGEPFAVLREGQAAGRLLGGNLTLVAALVGTPYLPSMDGAVLAIEDVDESPYRVDRLLSQLDLAGILDCIGAVLVGDFSRYLRDGASGPSVIEVVLDRVGDRPIPIVANVLHGHTDHRLTLPIGSLVSVAARGDESELMVTTPTSNG